MPINFSEIEKAFRDIKKPALMTVLKNLNRWDKSNAYFKNKSVFYSKKNPKDDMDYIDYGLSIVNNSIFDNFIKDKCFDISDIYENLSNEKLLGGFEVKERFYEIGSLNGLDDTINYFKNK